jgi:hypothetical protein
MATHDQKPDTTDSELSLQAAALAEQLGRIAGTLDGTAESWMNNVSFTEQLTRIRDGAARVLSALEQGARSARSRTTKVAPAAAAGRRFAARDNAHAPGKRHRKPAPSARGVKKSDERIPKMRVAAAVRRRRKYS